MSINNAKHIIAEFDGIRCTVVESGISAERLAFLRELLECNKFEVKVKEETSEVPGEPVIYTIGVTDLVFNPVFAVYDRSLRTKDGQFVSPGMWKQETNVYERMYWIK
jgi:hypothetical protein